MQEIKSLTSFNFNFSFDPEREKQAIEEAKWEALKERNRLFEKTNIKDARLCNTFENFKITNEVQNFMFSKAKLFVDLIKNQKLSWNSLCLYGNVGTGKTHIATAILKELCVSEKSHLYNMTQYFNCFYTTSQEITSSIQEATSYSKNKKFFSRDEAINWYSKKDVLVIDEVGRSSSKNNEEADCLFNVIDKLKENNKALVLCTNFNWEELSKFLGSALMSRIQSNCLTVDTSSLEDMRIKK